MRKAYQSSHLQRVCRRKKNWKLFGKFCFGQSASGFFKESGREGITRHLALTCGLQRRVNLRDFFLVMEGV